MTKAMIKIIVSMSRWEKLKEVMEKVKILQNKYPYKQQPSTSERITHDYNINFTPKGNQLSL